MLFHSSGVDDSYSVTSGGAVSCKRHICPILEIPPNIIITICPCLAEIPMFTIQEFLKRLVRPTV